MFERFSEGARATVEAAYVEARALGHDHIGTEHLLLGAAVAPGDAARVLADSGATPDALRAAIGAESGPNGEALATIGIDLDAIRSRVEAAFGEGALERPRRRGGRMRMSERAKKSLELAVREAVARGDRRIGTEHVLLGVLRDERATARGVLRRTGVDAADVRAALSPAASRPGRGG